MCVAAIVLDVGASRCGHKGDDIKNEIVRRMCVAIKGPLKAKSLAICGGSAMEAGDADRDKSDLDVMQTI